MIQEAVVFATKAHEGTVRKGSNIPYITHPLESAVIVSLITDDEEMIAAALLHDVIEDAGITALEIEKMFGKRVAGFVVSESEDKTKSWTERKESTVEHLKKAGRELKILTLGDKLSNIRSTAKDYMAVGDQIWDRFNEKQKNRQAWYYWGVADALTDLEGIGAYQEYVGLCRLVFGDR